ncbi:MAG: hypothetical protein Q7J10_00445 [Methanosarcinaceae archaeon]|nr:hypothetical protein [Methanosarcinaceae archaeon]
MIPDKPRDLSEKTKSIKIIDLSNDTIIWEIPEMGSIITLTKYPLCIKFENSGRDFKNLIQKHFDKMRETPIKKETCRILRDSIIDGTIDGEEIKSYNNMSLLHFFGTWLGPTINPFAKGHTIMNNLHYELFGFHQYHGKQYKGISRDEWTNLIEDCGSNCNHGTCLKHAKNKYTSDKTMDTHFYKSSHEVFLAYYNYMMFFKQNGNCEME